VIDANSRWELLVRAPAKINLSLEVLGTRPDGFHEIRTIMQAVSLCDEIGFRRRADGQARLECVGARLPEGEDNLIVRAARLLQRRYGVRAGVEVRLRKNIPVGGGLGGGSSDCAIALLALRELWQIEMAPAELGGLAAQLGSDAPFFLRGGTALCEGRGEVVTPIECAARMWYVLMMPGAPVSTAAVYNAVESALTKRPDASKNVLKALETGDVERLAQCVRNDLEAPALRLNAGLSKLWRQLKEVSEPLGVRRVLLSGSGSTFFAFTGGEDEATGVAQAVQTYCNVPCAVVQCLPPWKGHITTLTIGEKRL